MSTDPSRYPRFRLFRTATQNHWRVRGNLEGALARRLEELAAAEPLVATFEDQPPAIGAYASALEQSAPVGQTYRGPAFHFPDRALPLGAAVEITPAHFPLAHGELAWLPDEYEERAPMAGIIADGAIASLCASSVNPRRAAEASLHTVTEVRGRGYAPQVVALWAQLVRATDRRPLYSTEWTNTASRRVAAKLNLVEYGEDTFLT